MRIWIFINLLFVGIISLNWSCRHVNSESSSLYEDSDADLNTVSCVDNGSGADLVFNNQGQEIKYYFKSKDECKLSENNARAGIACIPDRPRMKLAKNGQASNRPGYRPTILAANLSLGRFGLPRLEDCTAATAASNNGIICTYTGTENRGYKPTLTKPGFAGEWCGSSVALALCNKSAAASGKKYFCSYPSEGLGSVVNGWSLTSFENGCRYETSGLSLDACIALIERKEN